MSVLFKLNSFLTVLFLSQVESVDVILSSSPLFHPHINNLTQSLYFYVCTMPLFPTLHTTAILLHIASSNPPFITVISSHLPPKVLNKLELFSKPKPLFLTTLPPSFRNPTDTDFPLASEMSPAAPKQHTLFDKLYFFTHLHNRRESTEKSGFLALQYMQHFTLLKLVK